MPIGGGVVVDRARIADVINHLRLSIPANVRQARGIIERGEQTIEDARREAERIIAAADREANARLAESEILRRAREQADTTTAAAEQHAHRTIRAADEQARATIEESNRIAAQQREDADAYAVALLIQLQRQLGAFLGNVRESLRAFPDVQSTDDA